VTADVAALPGEVDQ